MMKVETFILSIVFLPKIRIASGHWRKNWSIKKPDAIIDVLVLGAVELKKRTDTIPIVFVIVADPVGYGLVKSLANPGGNATGLSLMTTDLSGKRLEILKEAVPNLSQVALF